jgi:hypothetical protein
MELAERPIRSRSGRQNLVLYNNGLHELPVPDLIGPHGVARLECYFMIGLGATQSMAGGDGRGCAAGHAAKAGTNTSGASGLSPIEPCGRTVL